MLETRTAAPLPDAVTSALHQRVEDGRLDLPVLPQAAGQVLLACSDDGCDVRELSEILHRDPAMAGHVMRLANSPLHMPSVPIVSLPQAISRLGTSRIQRIAVIASCESRVFQVRGHEATMRAWFEHSLAAALYSEELARLKRWNVEEAFLAGLLHDVGRPILLQTVIDLAEACGASIEPEAAAAATEELHARVAADMIQSWNLPEMLAQIVRWHERPEEAPDSVRSAPLVALADELAHATLGPRPVDPASLQAHPVLRILNLYPDDLEELLDRADAIRKRVAALR